MLNLFDQAQSANMSGYHYSLQGWIIDSRWEGVGQRFVGKESVGGGGGVSILEWEGLWG